MAAGGSSWMGYLNMYHDLAYLKLDEALQLAEIGRHSAAISLYEEGLVLLDKALSVTVECPSNPDLQFEKACEKLQKMKRTRKEVLIQIADNQVTHPSDLRMEAPPSYEEAMASPSPTTTPSLMYPSLSPLNQPLTYSELGEALRNLKIETSTQSAEVIYSFDNVRIYFISPNGQVSAPSEPNQLKVLQLEDGGEQGIPKFFLQISDWFYPLVPKVSPWIRTEFGAYILPDLQSSVEGSAVGLILSPDSDASVHDILTDFLQGVIPQESITKEKVPVAPPRTRIKKDISHSISKGLVSGAEWISTGLVRGAEKAGEYMNSTTPKIISKLQPEQNPKELPPGVKTGVKIAKDVTGTAANVTGYVAGKVGSATMALGRYLAPHIQSQGTKLLKKTGVEEEKASKQIGGVLTVAAGAVESFGTVYTGLEQAASVLGTSLTENTVQVVRHKYPKNKPQSQ